MKDNPEREKTIKITIYNEKLFNLEHKLKDFVERDIIFSTGGKIPNCLTNRKIYKTSIPSNIFQDMLDSIHNNSFINWVSYWDSYFENNKKNKILDDFMYYGDFYSYYKNTLRNILFNERRIFSRIYNNKSLLPTTTVEDDKFCFICKHNDEDIVLEFICNLKE